MMRCGVELFLDVREGTMQRHGPCELTALDRGTLADMMHSLPLPVTIANTPVCSFTPV
jgi:hypothetical protein